MARLVLSSARGAHHARHDVHSFLAYVLGYDNLNRMWSAAQFRAIVSGQQRGLRPALWRAALRLAETPYALAMRWRNLCYDRGWAASYSVEVPVISVGNLTLGGTGKTPLVEWIALWLREQFLRVAIVSRGYGAAEGARNDEALELERKLPDVPHLQNPDRVAAARLAVEEFDSQVILLDDGFQHRRLRRDLDIVVLDALEPFGYGHVFPRGFLREPLAALRRADAIVLSRADLISADERQAVLDRVRPYAPRAVTAQAAHAPRKLVASDGNQLGLGTLRFEPVYAFCGIGNPDGFRRTLERLGYTVAGFREFPDHHAYARQDIEDLAADAQRCRAAALVCTEKDLVKLGVVQPGGVPLWAVRIGLDFIAGQAELERRLEEALRSRARSAVRE